MGPVPSYVDGTLRDGAGTHRTRWQVRETHSRTLDGETLLRYDNAHERSKGHERHAGDAVTEIEFPGMAALIRRFEREVDDLPL